MKKNSCLIYLLLGAIVNANAFAGIRVGNLSRNYAGTAKNTMAMQQQYYNANIEQDVYIQQDLPVQVANSELANQIRNGNQDALTNIAELNKCAAIYPNGEFIWDRPTIGRGAGGPATCVAVVEMRAIGAQGSSSYTAVARGKLAAGDSFNCNISNFSQSEYLPEIANTIFPADNPPTREDVVRVLNEEQKNKAGLKIAAAALVGGLGGNMVGKSAPGSDSMFGTNSEKVKTTAEGALLGAALMTASTYSGKVAGDVILHTGVNAAAGAVVGNMAASGDTILRVEKCLDGGIETTCLWGSIVKTSDEKLKNGAKAFYDSQHETVYICEDGLKKCKADNVWVVKWIKGKNKNIYISELKGITNKRNDIIIGNEADAYNLYTDNYENEMKPSESGVFYEAEVAKRAGAPLAAVIVGFRDSSAFGTKLAEWEAWKSANKNAKICLRDSAGNPYNCVSNNKAGATKETEAANTNTTQENMSQYTINDFNPLKRDADDGGVIDFSNKARLGSTLKGAGVGGALGGFSGYQGAQSDIEERFVQARREYSDSLEKFYCGSGTKYLGFYNDEILIPAMK